MRIKKYFLSILIMGALLAPSLLAPSLLAQDTGKNKPEKNSLITDEFSLVMRDLIKRSQAGDKGEVFKKSSTILAKQVDEIQEILNMSDAQVKEAYKIKENTSVEMSHYYERQEAIKLNKDLELYKKTHIEELKKSKAKIAEAQKNMKNVKKQTALKRANKSIEDALNLLEKQSTDSSVSADF